MSALTAAEPSAPAVASSNLSGVLAAALRFVWRAAIVLLVLLVAFLAWLVSVGDLYRPGSDLGYNLGLAGGLLMLSLLVYPLRKRLRALERLGRMDHWFRFHILAGTGGPLLVLFHSTFDVGSMNGAVALYAMVLVVISGIVGRFLYRHVHERLSGRHLTLIDAQANLASSAEGLSHVFRARPELEARLLAFREEATRPIACVGRRTWRFVTLRMRSRLLARQIHREARKSFARMSRDGSPDRRRMARQYRHSKARIDAFLEAAVEVSQIAIWERLFSLWHIVHLPFLYLLVLSGIAHVVAVHMY